jgi:PhnB protein
MESAAAREEVMGFSISPELSVRHGREAIDFYIAAFGARQVYRVAGTDDAPDVVAELAIGDTSFWVSDEAPAHGNFSPESLGGGTVRLLLRVDDPHTVYARALALGAREIAPIAEEHGWLLGRLEDPFGHHWEIGKPLIAWPPESGRPGHHSVA